jgi:1-acyl-sn-glycerol-3-phosphate acyltransferase
VILPLPGEEYTLDQEADETFFRLSYSVCQSVFRLLFHLSVKGREHIPETGPFIAASNHISYFDPIIIGSLLKREIAFLAKAELFDQFLVKDLIRKLNPFPIQRGKSDITSIKTCIRILQNQKKPLLMFPEGTRIKMGELATPQRGIAFITAQTKVPLLPIYIENSNHLAACFFFKRRLKVRFGKLLSYDQYKPFMEDTKQYSELARFIMSKIQDLKDAASRG